MTLKSAVEGLFGNTPVGLTPAAQPLYDPVDAVNDPAGYPTQETYPGAVATDHSGDDNLTPMNAIPSGTVEASDPFSATLPPASSGGGWQDTAWLAGHEGSSGAVAGNPSWLPFAGPGAIDPAQYGDDTGGVYDTEHVVPAEIGSLTRHTGGGQTYNRVANTQTLIGQMAENNRINLDQQQWHDPGYIRRVIEYAERPIYNNTAYEAQPIEPTGSIYTPAGALPNRAPINSSQSEAYSAPPAPDVMTTQAPAQQSDVVGSGDWMAG